MEDTMIYRIDTIEGTNRWEVTCAALNQYQEGNLSPVVTVYSREQGTSAWLVDGEVNLREIVEDW